MTSSGKPTRSVARLLAELAEEAAVVAVPAAARRLLAEEPRAVLRRRPARVVVRRDPEADPITGLRGAGAGLHVVARVPGLVLEFQLRRDDGRRTLLGQVACVSSRGRTESLVGAMAHVRTAGGSALAPVDARGEFAAPSLPEGDVLSVDLELEDRVITVACGAGKATA